MAGVQGKVAFGLSHFCIEVFQKKVIGLQIPMKIPTWPCIGTGKWEMWMDSLFWTHLQSDVGENYQVWSLESGLSRDLTSVCDKFLFLALAVMRDIGCFFSFGLFSLNLSSQSLAMLVSLAAEGWCCRIKVQESFQLPRYEFSQIAHNSLAFEPCLPPPHDFMANMALGHAITL